MIWLEFLGSAAILVAAATQLAKYGDIIALRTKLGGMFVGTLLLAGATSLPELLTAINAVDQNAPNLTVGNIFGSNMFNICLLAILDLTYWRSHIMRQLNLAHALSAGVAIGLTGLAIFFILAQFDMQVGWVGLDSISLIIAYVLMTRLLFSGQQGDPAIANPEPDIPADVPSLRHAGLGFIAATVVLILITPLLVSSSVGIAAETGISTGFVGVALVGIATSLPELVTTLSAARIGAYDLAAGNLFGSNIFNIFALGITDFFYTDGRFLKAVSSDMVLAGIIALLLAHVSLLAMLVRNLAPRGTRRLVVEVDSLLIVFGYVIGMAVIYSHGLL